MGSSRVPAPLTRDEPLFESCLLECHRKVATSISKAATEISAEFYINVNLKLYFMCYIGPEKSSNVSFKEMLAIMKETLRVLILKLFIRQ